MKMDIPKTLVSFSPAMVAVPAFASTEVSFFTHGAVNSNSFTFRPRAQ